MKTIIGTSVKKAKELLDKGEVVSIPTETVYGLAANGLNYNAVTSIFDIKNRPHYNPLILHTDDLDKIEIDKQNVHSKLKLLMYAFWPGPLTILFSKPMIVPNVVTSNLSKVAVRMPVHPLTKTLLSMIDYPLAAPSANPFGYVSPTKAIHVADQLHGKIPYILDGGTCKYGIESTIIEIQDNDLVVLRSGSIAIESIEAIVGKVRMNITRTSNPSSPGQLERHYSPYTKIVYGGNMEEIDKNKSNVGFLGWNRFHDTIPHCYQRILAIDGSFETAAANLYDFLRELDKMNLDVIYAQKVPNKNLGVAINDKLKRASV